MAIYVLIAGACHRGACWSRIQERLEAAGHHVIAPELLPGMDNSPPDPQHAGLDLWAHHVADILTAQAEPVILVGHSRGGIVISQAAELAPDSVRHLVYVTAALIPDGQSMHGFLTHDPETVVEDAIIVSPDGLILTINPEAIPTLFYNCSTSEQIAEAKSWLVPEPMASMGDPIRLSEARFGRIPKRYIECLQDKTIPIGMQRRMQACWPCQSVITLDSDHSPFISMPAPLAQALLDLA